VAPLILNIKVHIIKTYGVEEANLCSFLILGTTWTCRVTIAPWWRLQSPVVRRLVGPQRRPGRGSGENNFCSCRGSVPRCRRGTTARYQAISTFSTAGIMWLRW